MYLLYQGEDGEAGAPGPPGETGVAVSHVVTSFSLFVLLDLTLTLLLFQHVQLMSFHLVPGH